MNLRAIRAGHWYETPLGFGECLDVDGTYPAVVKIRVTWPVRRGVLLLRPRRISRELTARERRTASAP